MGLASQQCIEKCNRRGELDAHGLEDLCLLCSINSKALAKFSGRVGDAREAAAINRLPSLVVVGLPALLNLLRRDGVGVGSV